MSAFGHKKSVSNQKFTVSERQETQLKGVLPYWLRSSVEIQIRLVFIAVLDDPHAEVG